MFNQFGQYIPDNPYNQFANRSPVNGFAQRYEIIHVNGKAGADALQMAPNSNAIVMDDTAPLVWLCQTDGAGYKTVTPFRIEPYKPQPPVDVNSFEARIKRLEDIINVKSHDENSESVQNGAAEQSSV